MDYELLYTAITAFLKATRNMLGQLEHHEATFLLKRVASLELKLQAAYQQKDRGALRLLGQHADDLAVEILARLAGPSHLPSLESDSRTRQDTLARA